MGGWKEVYRGLEDGREEGVNRGLKDGRGGSYKSMLQDWHECFMRWQSYRHH